MTVSNGARMHQMPSRTIAILAGVACNTHRLAIQAHITQDGFTILSERVEQWSIETDQDFLTEFLRDEEKMDLWMQRLTGAQIYVMVLEGQDAENGWLELCGPDLDDEEEEKEPRLNEDGLHILKTGLRARYGAATLYGSSVEGAPRQIAICFPDLASFDALDALHTEGEKGPNTIAAVGPDGKFLVRDELDIAYDDRGRAFDVHTGDAIDLQSEARNALNSVAPKKSMEGGFKARPSPSSTKKPIIQPRLSKAAALRMGVALPDASKREATKTTSNDESLGISGLPRANIALPKSLMAPSIAPRLNRVAAARTKTTSSVSEAPSVVKEKKAVDYSNTPGHKRVSLSASRPASLAAPSVMPRLNKAATGRLGSSHGVEERDSRSIAASSVRTSSSVSPTTTRKPVDFSGTPGHKRASLSTSTIKSLQAPTLAPRSNRVSMGRSGPNKALGDGAAIANQAVKQVEPKKVVDYSNTPGHKRASTDISISSLAQPTIAPRINTAAMKRMSIGAINASEIATAQLNKPRPMITNGNMNSSTATRSSSSLGRPSSRISLSSAHQDGAFPRAAPSRRSAAPPSSFKM